MENLHETVAVVRVNTLKEILAGVVDSGLACEAKDWHAAV